MLYLAEFVWTLCPSGLVIVNNFLLIDATDRSKISSDQKRFFIALSQYPLSFLANIPFKNNFKNNNNCKNNNSSKIKNNNNAVTTT